MTAPFSPREHEAVGDDAPARTLVSWMRLDPGHFPERVCRLITEAQATHVRGAPVVRSMPIHASESCRRRFQHSVQIGAGTLAADDSVVFCRARMARAVLQAGART